jgi:hypothetical protein
MESKMSKTVSDKRIEPRTVIDQFYSVELSAGDFDLVRHFKIWNISSKGMCFVVKSDSELLEHLKVGQVLDMKYYKSDARKPAESLKTQIRHLTEENEGQFKGHHLIGLAISENHGR